MFIIIIACLGVVTGLIARSKGRSFFGWWLYGAALFIVALPHILIIKGNTQEAERRQLATGESKRCPFCAELIKTEAQVCRFCSRDLPPSAICPQCQYRYQSKPQFCSNCSHQFDPTVPTPFSPPPDNCSDVVPGQLDNLLPKTNKEWIRAAMLVGLLLGLLIWSVTPQSWGQ
jgi:hypothetical protein